MVFVVELSPQEIREDKRFPEVAANYILPHLKYYLGKQKTLPAIRIIAENESLILIGGHRYLRAAKELGIKSIRAIVDNRSDARMVDALSRARRVIPEEEWDEPINGPRRAWHVFNFDEPLHQSSVDAFRRFIEGQFSPHQFDVANAEGSAVIHEFNSDLQVGRIEFEADTPVADEAWVAGFIAGCQEFNKTVHPIKTYQGSLWTAV